MTKILKKSLACLLAFVLCFTAIAGCLAVSAEKTVSSISYDVLELDNNNQEWQLCPGETVRGFVQVNGIKANTTVGITLELPKHAEITKINPFGDANGQEISRYFDAEEGILTIVFKVAKDGYWNHLVYFNVTDATPKGVVYYDCTVDAAIKSNDSDDDHYINTVTRHFEVKAHEAAAAVHENNVEATCTTDGSYDEVVYCKWGDNEEISRNTVTVDALGHDYEGVANPDSTCNSEGTMVYTCKNDASHTYTEAISKKDHTPAADLVNNGDNHSVVCDVCKVVLETADHDFTNGDCACGAAKPSQGVTEDPNLKFQGVSMAFGTSSLEMNFRVRQTVLNLYDRVELVIIPQKYNTSTKNYAVPEEIVVQESQMGGTSIRTYQYTDMMLYELALDVQYKLRAYDGDVLVAESALASKSAVSYLKNDVLNGTGAGITEDLKRVAVDMLIVCEEARKAMATAGSQLEADSKVSVLDGVNLSLATPEVNKNHNKVNNFDPSADGWGILDTDKYYVKTSVAMEKVPVLGLRITDNREFDLNKFNIKVSYTSASSAGYQEENLTGAKLTRSGKFITTKFTNVGLHDSNADITLEFSYDGVVKGTLTYSMETFLGSSLEDPTIGKLAGALLNLGASFRKLKGY